MTEQRIAALLPFIPAGCIGYLTAPADLFYYAGFTGEGAALINEKNRIILTDGRYVEQARKQAPSFQVANCLNHFKVLKDMGLTVLFQKQVLPFGVYEQMEQYELDTKPFAASFPALRSIKDEEEINALRSAARIAEKALEETMHVIAAGKTEKEIAAYLDYTMARLGAEKSSFDTICISGTNTSLPHGVPSQKKIEAGDFLTIDFGCIVDGYCSDMTRTFAIGEPSEKMKEVYQVVFRAQEETQAALTAGMKCSEADGIARRIIQEAGYGDSFVHSTGHGVGIEIHESPNLSPKSCAVLEAGNIVTVEPGIYLAGEFGVRIENTVVIRDQGCEPLQKMKKELIIL